MRKILLTTLCLALMSCGPKVKVPPIPQLPTPPHIPDLSSDLEKKCPALDPLTSKSKAELTSADIKAALQYAKCQKKHSSVVEMYKVAQEMIERFIANVNEVNKANGHTEKE